jgi:Flp pilus assembly pilin Flp
MLFITNAVMRRYFELRDREEGQTLIEYALLATLIAIAAIVLMFVVGFDIQETFDKVEEALGLDAGDTTAVPAGDEHAEAN